MVVEARRTPVVGELAEIEIVAGDLRLAPADDGFGAGVVRDRRHARRTAQTFLTARRRDVDAPAIDRDLDPAEAHDGIRQQERVVCVRDARDLFEGLQDSGGRLAMHDRHELRAAAVERGGDRIGLDHATPFGAYRDHLRAAALGDLEQE